MWTPVIAALASLLLLAAAGGCPAPIENTSIPVDLDRQCEPQRGEMACREGLLCVRLFEPRVLSDGGLMSVDNFTCHPPCSEEVKCLDGYTCYYPPSTPMQGVCASKKVVTLLQQDGGL